MPKPQRRLGFPYMRTPEQARAHAEHMLESEKKRLDETPEDQPGLRKYLSHRISALTRILNEH